jgi:hypothetical protein
MHHRTGACRWSLASLLLLLATFSGRPTAADDSVPTPPEPTDLGLVVTPTEFDAMPTVRAASSSCGNACRGACSCCPGWSQYAIFDVLFLQRDNATNGQVITEDYSGGAAVPLFNTQTMQAATAPGIRLFYGQLGPDQIGWEMGYTGVYGMFGDARAVSVNNLAVPGVLGTRVAGWLTADEVRPTYASSLNMFEANVFHYRCCTEGGCDSPFPWERVQDPYCHCTNLLFGLRWAGLEEAAALNVRCCEGDPFSSYAVNTSSQMIGPQVGLRGRKQWNCWATEWWAKAMLAGTILSSNADPITSSLTGPNVVYRESRHLTQAGVGFVGDLNYSLVRRLSDTWWLRCGYNLIWLSGVALAPDQFDFTDTAASGTTLVGGGSVFLHGANLGLEKRW